MTTTTTDYEQAVLGAVLRGYPDLPTLARSIEADDFASAQHAAIWQACLAVHAAGLQPDPLTVLDRMGNAAQRLPGGAVYLADLDAPVIVQAPQYAAKVREQRIRREVASLGVRCQQMLTDEDAEPSDLIANIRTWADNIGTRRDSGQTTVTSALEQVIEIAQHGEPAALTTPWPDINELIGGLHPGQLVVIGARPGVGKSIALENLATHVAREHGRWVLFVTLEMSAAELMQRTMAHTTRVELGSLRSGRVTEAEWARVDGAMAELSALPMRYVDQFRQTVDAIRGHAWELRQEAIRSGSELGMVVVDYIQLITPKADRTASRQQRIGQITRDLKALAKELKVPVVTAAQLNRQGAGRQNPTPMLSDLREAGDIEQDADDVLLLHEQEVEDSGRTIKTGDLEVIVAKQRHGPTGTRTLKKFGHYSLIAS